MVGSLVGVREVGQPPAPQAVGQRLCSLSAVHRIGRTGRSGNTGIATTFINKACGKAAPSGSLPLSPGPLLWPPRSWLQGLGLGLTVPYPPRRVGADGPESSAAGGKAEGAPCAAGATLRG